ncbi:hypothetical protein [Variovorax saccharolyticus]|uniref:hypothetical protein n=1 Tax=Variovorax saccharolyticus TaxID=3053516 RepID=UPI0025766D23|nr:hypothetical protein [Variovorax sp. J31P216]MDM0029661.1 hypothetical protein [Variovorax sp. J31P216]
MSDSSFGHRGHQVEIKAWQVLTGWAWLFQIDDLAVENSETGARSKDQALIEARHAAIATIRKQDENLCGEKA